MEELLTEEKAKRYDEAIKVAADIKAGTATYITDGTPVIDAIFPELVESEDERIRKWIIDDIRYNMDNEPLNNSEYKKNAEKAVAWLEKQGEQKPIEWSEEDEKMIENIIDTINMSIEDCDVDDVGTKARFTLEKERDWLKSLKERYTWKPSDEQIEALVSAIDVMIDNRGAGDKNTILLSGLYHELKTL